MPENIEIDGRNILPLATGEAEVFERPDDAIFWSSGYYKVVRSGDWKLQVNERQSKSWLFNLAEDPTEMVNLIKSHPEKAADLQALIDRHWAGARPPLYPFTTETPVRIDKTNADPAGPDDEYVYWPN